jgi:DNA-binding NarL/FixJ family response regulator
MTNIKIVFWSNHLNINLSKILPLNMAHSLTLIENKTFDEVDAVLSTQNDITAIITSLCPTDLQALCCIQKIQRRYPDVALVAVLDTLQQLSSVYDALRMLLGRFHQRVKHTSELFIDDFSKATIIDAKEDYREATSQDNTTENAALLVIPESDRNARFDTNNTSSILTPRQQGVLGLLMRGKSNKEIARFLGLSEGTIKIHCMSIYRALGVKNRTQAAMRAEQLLPELSALWGVAKNKETTQRRQIA